MIRKPLTCEELVQMGGYSKRQLAQCAQVISNNRGCTTPVEEFLSGLIREHVDSVALTPDDIAEHLADLRQNYEHAIEAGRLLAHQYPAQILGTNSGATWSDQVAALNKAAAERAARPEDELLQGLCLLEIARRAIREYPALVMAEEIPEPWVNAEAITQAAKAKELTFHQNQTALGNVIPLNKPN